MDAAAAARAAAGPVNQLGRVRFGVDGAQPETADLVERHQWFRVYMVGRCAALGGAHRTGHAAMALFPAGLVRNAFQRVADSQPLAEFRAAYVDATAAIGDRVHAHLPDAEAVAASLARLVDALDFAGRPLAASWADLPVPDGLGARIERSATVLREARGEGHLAVLTTHGLLGPEALLLTGLWRGREDAEAGARFFGWRDDDVARAWERLELAGRVDAGHRITPDGAAEREAIEELTNALAAQPWTAFTDDERTRTVDLLAAAAAELP